MEAAERPLAAAAAATEPPLPLSLLDLGGSLYPLLLTLAAEDLARLSQCCQFLRTTCYDESLWRALCARCSPAADAWRAALRLGSYRHTHLALCWLGQSPLGLWVEESGTYCNLPYGNLPLLVSLRPDLGCLEVVVNETESDEGRAVGQLCRLRFHLHQSRLWCQELWSNDPEQASTSPALLLQMRRSWREGIDAPSAWSGEARVPLRASAFPAATSANARRCLRARPLSDGGFWGASASTAAPADVETAFLQLPSPAFAPAQLPQPPPLDEGLSWLSGLAGLYYGVYGPHGYELIQVRWLAEVSNDAALPPDLQGKPGVLVGSKVTGDPNVPCGELSFAASGLAQGDALAGDRLAYISVMLGRGRAAGQEVDLGARRRAAVCELRGAMQINLQPGMWAPDWLPATLLVYRPGAVQVAGIPSDVAFSVLTDMEGSGRSVYASDFRALRRDMLGLSENALLEL